MLNRTYNYLRDQIRVDEGLRLFPYEDTAGNLTIGYGHNLDANGIPENIAERLLDHDMSVALEDAWMFVGGTAEFCKLDDVRQCVLVNMAFNMGRKTLNSFVKFRAALVAGDYIKAADEMMDSNWARSLEKMKGRRRIETRAERLARQMRSGRW